MLYKSFDSGALWQIKENAFTTGDGEEVQTIHRASLGRLKIAGSSSSPLTALATQRGWLSIFARFRFPR